MEIDLRTVILIIGIAHFMQVLVFSQQYKANKNLSGPGWWLMWSAAEFLGFGLILLREIPSISTVAIAFQNIIILLGTVFVYIGVKRFFGVKVNLKFIVSFFISFILLHLFFLFVVNDINIRTFILDVFISVIAFLTAICIYKNKTESIKSTAIFNAVILTMHGSIFAYRVVMIIAGTSVTDVFSPSLFNLIQYFDALFVGLLWTFGFIMMLNQRLNAEISEAKSHFEQIFNTSPDSAVITRLNDGIFVDCNDGFTKLTGYTKEEIIGKSALSYNLYQNPEDRNFIIREIQEKGSCENYELMFYLKNGELVTCLMSAKIISLYGVLHIISITRDISDRKQKEAEIHQKNEELQKINAEKDKFFSIIAHDLRGPFGSFMQLTQAMSEDLSSFSLAEIQEIAVCMSDLATNLYNLLENLLEWTQMKQGLIPYKPRIFHLQLTVDESIKMVLNSAKTKGITLTIDVPEDMVIVADRYMMEVVIRNLVSNAVKYTFNGGKVNLSARTNNDKSIEFSVRDTGIGMSKSLIEDLFVLNVKSSRKGTDGEPSTGLGLSLCKEFVEKHGGKIWVESEEGKGCIFYFTIPQYD